MCAAATTPVLLPGVWNWDQKPVLALLATWSSGHKTISVDRLGGTSLQPQCPWR